MNIAATTRNRKQRGFTLLEMMIVVLLLMIVSGAVFSQIHNVQLRYRAEELQIDITQATRETVDLFIRDVHQAGYPNNRMYSSGALSSPTNDASVAVGLVAISSRDLWFEGDIDQNGTVESVRYQLTAAGGNCPCTLRRSVQTKIAGAPTAQTVSYATQLENVVNSNAVGGMLTVDGTMTYPDGTAVTNDVAYANYKVAPVFMYYDAAGAQITVPTDIDADLSTASNLTLLRRVRSVRLNLNVLSGNFDPQTRMRAVIAVSATGKLNN